MRTTLLFAILTAGGIAADLPVTFAGGADLPISGAPPGYESVHYGAAFTVSAQLPNGDYRVTLRFLEPTVQGPLQRVFDVTANDLPVLTRLDLFRRAGFMAPLVRTFAVSVTGGRLDLEFSARIRNALFFGVAVEPAGTAGTARQTVEVIPQLAGDGTYSLPAGFVLQDLYANGLHLTQQTAAGEVGPLADYSIRGDGNIVPTLAPGIDVKSTWQPDWKIRAVGYTAK